MRWSRATNSAVTCTTVSTCFRSCCRLCENAAKTYPCWLQHFAKTFSQRMGKPIRQIPPETLEAFILYSWPGNVRELQNLIERAVIRSNDGVLPNPLPAVENNPVTLSPKQGTLTDSTRDAILQALRASGWVVAGPGGAAARLGIKRTTLIAKMKKLGISRPDPISYASQFGEDENSGLAL